MKEIFTQYSNQSSGESSTKEPNSNGREADLPRHTTLDFIRNFARAYTADGFSRLGMPGIVLN